MGSHAQPAPWYRKGRDMWFATINGQQISLGIKGLGSEEQAQTALLEILRQSEQCQTAQHSATLGESVAAFLAKIAHRVKRTTLTGYRWFLAEAVRELGAATRLAAITPEAIEASSRRAAWSQSTRHGYLGAVCALLRDAGITVRIRRPGKESRGAEAVWSHEEWLMMLGASRGDFRPLLIVLKETGCRPAEAAALTVESVDWDNRHAVLKKHKNAGKGKSRTIHFSDAAFAVLLAQKHNYGSGALFLNEHMQQFTALSLSRRCALCRERAGIKRPITLYGLRHWYCTRALAHGASNAQVAALVGNSEAMIHKHYSHIDADARLLKELAERVSKRA